MAAETAAARATRDLEFAEKDRVKRDFASQSAERLARLYNDSDGHNDDFDEIVVDSGE